MQWPSPLEPRTTEYEGFPLAVEDVCGFQATSREIYCICTKILMYSHNYRQHFYVTQTEWQASDERQATTNSPELYFKTLAFRVCAKIHQSIKVNVEVIVNIEQCQSI